MLVGYNTNISYKNKIYHIQTEDNGRSNPVIVTLLYSEGAILSSKRTNYANLLDEPDSNDKIRNLMKEQHKDMIKGLVRGKYTDTSDPPKDPANSEAEPEPKAVETQSAEIVKPQDAEIKEVEPRVEPSPQGEIKDRNQITTSLDDILLNYIMKRAK